MKRVLVTGAHGQLGRSIQDLSVEFASLKFLFLNKIQLDITKSDKVCEAFLEFQPQYCINCAAYTLVDQAEKSPEPAYAVNVKGVENLVRACNETGTILIHISTDYVFDGKKEEGYYPKDEPNPINVYGKTKLEGERIIKQSLDRYFIIRTSWLYSKKHGPNFYLKILEKAKKGETLTVTDSQRGCPTDAANLARYILELIRLDRMDYGISHYTDGVSMTWYVFAHHIKDKEAPESLSQIVKGDNYRSFAKRPVNSVLLPIKLNLKI